MNLADILGDNIMLLEWWTCFILGIVVFVAIVWLIIWDWRR